MSQPAWNRQQPGPMPFGRYRALEDTIEAVLPDRTWPDRPITRAPLWVPVDLRDGNQALAEPMDPARKRRFFEMLVRIGFKEIEVGYPAASEPDFDFVRELIEDGLIPDDVTIVVLTPARPELIARTLESLEGAPRPMVHLYNATAPLWRETVLGVDRAGAIELALQATAEIQRHAAGTLRFQYSPETFSQTERDLSVEICNAVVEQWGPTPEDPITINLPATVEAAPPHIYADQIEWLDRHLTPRDAVIISTHPHNDRGTGVASAEYALMAGAQRVEGCLFGNGERTGNVCLITLALNLFTRGIDPQLDLRDIDAIRATVEHCNRLSVHHRHPYVGDLVHTAYSGTHQDAINKGFAARVAEARAEGVPVEQTRWQVPYLPIDPHDLNRTYEAVIQVNSQSGKGGLAFLMEMDHGLVLPRSLQIALAAAVQPAAEAHGGVITSQMLWSIFAEMFLYEAEGTGSFRLKEYRLDHSANGRVTLEAQVVEHGEPRTLSGEGSGPLEALTAALTGIGHAVRIDDYHEHARGTGADAEAAAYVLVREGDEVRWGVGIDASTTTASMQALLAGLSALNARPAAATGSIAGDA